jgi:hypothetical protein
LFRADTSALALKSTCFFDVAIRLATTDEMLVVSGKPL